MGLCWYFDSMSKGQIKLGGFYTSFAEITDENELGIRFPLECGAGVHRQFIPCPAKSQATIRCHSIFFRIFLPTGQSRCAYGKPVREDVSKKKAHSGCQEEDGLFELEFPT